MRTYLEHINKNQAFTFRDKTVESDFRQLTREKRSIEFCRIWRYNERNIRDDTGESMGKETQGRTCRG